MKTIKYFLTSVITAITFLSTSQITSKLPLVVAVSQTNPSCNGMNDGEITLTISGGVQPYIVNGLTLNTSIFTMSNLTSGVYDVLIYDSYNGGAGGSIILTDPVAPSISYVIGDETNSDQNGLIELTVSPTPLSYQWQSLTSTVLTNPNDEDQYNLSSGWYAVTITDVNGCEYIKRFNVQQYMSPVINGNFVNTNFVNNNSTNMMINNVGNHNTTRSDRGIVYPNPSNGNINIKNDDKQYQIISLTSGEIIDGSDSNINLKKGSYILNIDGATEKFLIK